MCLRRLGAVKPAFERQRSTCSELTCLITSEIAACSHMSHRVVSQHSPSLGMWANFIKHPFSHDVAQYTVEGLAFPAWREGVICASSGRRLSHHLGRPSSRLTMRSAFAWPSGSESQRCSAAPLS